MWNGSNCYKRVVVISHDLTEQLRFGPTVPQDGLKDPEEGFGQLVLQIVGCVYGHVVLQDIDWILSERKNNIRLHTYVKDDPSHPPPQTSCMQGCLWHWQ